MTDILERLVTLVACGAFGSGDAAVMLEAADEIVRLRAELRHTHIDNAAAWGQPQGQAEEVERLRALITEWAEADRGEAEGSYDRFREAVRALRREANR